MMCPAFCRRCGVALRSIDRDGLCGVPNCVAEFSAWRNAKGFRFASPGTAGSDVQVDAWLSEVAS